MAPHCRRRRQSGSICDRSGARHSRCAPLCSGNRGRLGSAKENVLMRLMRWDLWKRGYKMKEKSSDINLAGLNTVNNVKHAEATLIYVSSLHRGLAYGWQKKETPST